MQLDKQEILSKINALEITEWNYKMESPEVKHIGPFAEEFHAQFGLNGSDNTMISTTDPSGVALVGVQALTEQVEELKAENVDLRAENAALKEVQRVQDSKFQALETKVERMKTLEAELEAIKAALNLDEQTKK